MALLSPPDLLRVGAGRRLRDSGRRSASPRHEDAAELGEPAPLKEAAQAIGLLYARYLGGLTVFIASVRWFFVGVVALAIVTVIFLVITGMFGVGDSGGY